LPATTAYKNYSVNIRNYTNQWNKTFTSFRFDLGKKNAQELSFKNIYLKKEIDYTSFNKNKDAVEYAQKNFLNNIVSVKVNADKIIISGNIQGNTNMYVSELPVYMDVQSRYTTISNAIALNSKTFEISVPRFAKINDTMYDRIYSRWIIASKVKGAFIPESYAHYADDIYAAAKQYLPEEKPQNKKGLAGFVAAANTVPELDSLQIKNVTVNIAVTGLVSIAPTQYGFQFNDATYYFNPQMVANLDKTLQSCSAHDVLASAIILISRKADDSIKNFLFLPVSNNGVYSLANISSVTGLNYFAAAIAFLADRYSKPGKKFGRINNWIIHNEVDEGFYWANAGNAKMQYYTELYDRVCALFIIPYGNIILRQKCFYLLRINGRLQPTIIIFLPKTCSIFSIHSVKNKAIMNGVLLIILTRKMLLCLNCGMIKMQAMISMLLNTSLQKT